MHILIIAATIGAANAFSNQGGIINTPRVLHAPRSFLTTNNFQQSRQTSRLKVALLEVGDTVLQEKEEDGRTKENKIDPKGDNFVFGLSDSGLVRGKGESDRLREC